MSLVAYGSSDESDQSDVEESKNDDRSVQSQNHTSKTPEVVEAGNSLIQDDQFSDSDTEYGTAVRGNAQNSLDNKLKELPTPKAADSGLMVETDELEDEVKPKPSQVADVEKPLPRKARQPVKITIPALPDSDEDDEPAAKRPRPGSITVKSGLFSMLPAPVHAAKKEAGRILLPYSLTKKTQSAASSANAQKKSNSNNVTSQNTEKSRKLSASLADYGSNSDDEDDTGEPVSFFSLDSSVNKTDSTVKSSNQNQMVGPSLPPENTDKLDSNSQTGIPTVPLPPTIARTSLNLPAPARSNKSQSGSESLSVSSSENVSDTVGKATGPFIDPDAPLTFRGGVTSQRAYSSLYNSNSAVSSSVSSSSTAAIGMAHSTAEGDQNMYYNMPYDSMQYPESTDVAGFQQDNEFLRLQGKKQRGKEEINLIDVNADDFTDPSEITKHLSEEQTYHSHKTKDNQPTGQQKRKHQIQYLAFQAKERELELKNQWSQNRQTKKQTQAKYGF